MKRGIVLVVSCAGLVLAITFGCRTGAHESAAPQPDWDAASVDGPVLIGVVRHPDGHGLEGIQVTAHGGLATRWPLASTTTDADGRFRFSPVEGTPVIDSTGGASKLFVGVCVGSVTNVNPAAVLPWKDVYVEAAAEVVVRVDFVFDPDSVPVEYRD